MIFATLIFILMLAILILGHETGHFLMAKKMGIKVEEFGIGFPPRLFSFKKNETTYSINLLPLGGFVKLLGENGQSQQDSESFASKKIYQRAIVLVAGVLMNLILAWFFASTNLMIGAPQSADADSADVPVQVIEIIKNSPAEKINIELGDKILSASFDNESVKINNPKDLTNFVLQHQGQTISLEVQKGSSIINKEVKLPENSTTQNGILGVGLAKIELYRYPWYIALWKGLVATLQTALFFTEEILKIIYSALTGHNISDYLSGPLGIARITFQAVKMGLGYVLQLAFLLSINLAVLNILPIPALDGGRLLFLAIEKIKGSPINSKIEQRANMAGFIALIVLMILVTIKDIIK
jgi:regulator of sigma E protease